MVAVRVNDYLHEFASIPGVVEDVFEILLNLRHLAIRLHTHGPKRMILRANAIGPVTARMIEHDADIEIVNPDHYICEIGDQGEIELEMIVRKGRGFVSAERNQEEDLPRGFIPVASLHSPVRKVNFHVEAARVGRRTEYENLLLEIWTNGTVTPVEALNEAVDLWVRHAEIFRGLEPPEPVPAEEVAEAEKAPTGLTEAADIEELGLSTRVANVLKSHDIDTVGKLLKLTPGQLSKIPNIGPRSFQEIIEQLRARGLRLAGE